MSTLPILTALYGRPVKVDNTLGWESVLTQVHFPRSKKKRIRNKWKKQHKNYKVLRFQTPHALMMGNQIIMNQPAWNHITRSS